MITKRPVWNGKRSEVFPRVWCGVRIHKHNTKNNTQKKNKNPNTIHTYEFGSEFSDCYSLLDALHCVEVVNETQSFRLSLLLLLVVVLFFLVCIRVFFLSSAVWFSFVLLFVLCFLFVVANLKIHRFRQTPWKLIVDVCWCLSLKCLE